MAEGAAYELFFGGKRGAYCFLQACIGDGKNRCEPPSTKALNNPPILSPPKGGHLRLPVLSSLQPPILGGTDLQ